jgi:peptidyl-prolyl cis-trans isomerase C
VLKRSAMAALLSASAVAQGGELSLAACTLPAYPPEALRYEIEGTAQIGFVLAGGAPQPCVVSSSGSRVLDRASLEVAATCKFTPAADAASSLAIPWKLQDSARAERAPVLMPDSCRVGYKVLQFVAPDSPRRNLSLRVQVWSDGRAFTPRIEQSSGDELVDKEALQVAESCDFRPGMRAGAAVRSAALLTMAFDRAAISEDKVRAMYDTLAAKAALAKDYKVRHILLPTESAARAALAEASNPARFGAIARAQSLDKPSGKVDGALGWLRPTDTVPEFSKALAEHGKPGLLPSPVKSPFGWHVIEIEDARPSYMPPYDDEARGILSRRLVGEREIIVQTPPSLKK